MKIRIQTVDHAEQRYPTCGDWQWTKPETLTIRVSKTRQDYELLVAIHELVEAVLCQAHGIPEKLVDQFDRTIEEKRHEARERGEQAPDTEPGDYPQAPYYREHQIATGIERMLAAEMGVSWLEYEKAVDALG